MKYIIELVEWLRANEEKIAYCLADYSHRGYTTFIVVSKEVEYDFEFSKEVSDLACRICDIDELCLITMHAYRPMNNFYDLDRRYGFEINWRLENITTHADDI